MPARAACSVLLIGFQDQDNLGLRYLLSAVRQAGFSGWIQTYSSDPEPIAEICARLDPDVIGFSLIFQYMSPVFAKAIQTLRARGCQRTSRSAGTIPASTIKRSWNGSPASILSSALRAK